MEPNEFNNINNKIYTNNNNILLEIINDLQQLINYSKDNIIIKRLSDSIIKLNDIINENKKNTQLIINHISNFCLNEISAFINIINFIGVSKISIILKIYIL